MNSSDSLPASDSTRSSSGGQRVVAVLEQLGVTRVFCVPGESYLPVLDALYDSPIAVTVCRHEGGAAMMAEAWGKLSTTPGVVLVTRGPGACNASSGVHVAAQDSTPLLLLIGQIHRAIRYREAFQEVDYHQMFGGMAKWVAEIEGAERVPEMLFRAWHTAISGRPGPVVLALPEDTLSETCVQSVPHYGYYPPGDVGIDAWRRLDRLLSQSRSPVAIVGGSGWDAAAVARFRQFVEYYQIPVMCSFRRQMLFDHLHPAYAGDLGLGVNPDLLQLIGGADLLLIVGSRLSEIPSQDYTLPGDAVPDRAVVHVLAGEAETGKVFQPTLAFPISPRVFCQSLDKLSVPTAAEPRRVADAHQSYLAWSSLERTVPEGAVMRQLMMSLAEHLPNDAVITNGAGNYATWIHRFWRFRQYGTQLAPTSGSMGYGLPAAIAAALHDPERTIVAFAGDGCLQMTLQELGTAVQERAALLVLVIDNGMYGTIRMHQERHYPGRVSSTGLLNPDFAALAAAYGMFSGSVDEPDAVDALVREALAHVRQKRMPAMLHVRLDPNVITPTTFLPRV